VVTGDLWNAGTDAAVSLTIHGETGDTGPRLLRLSRSRAQKMFAAGQVAGSVINVVQFSLNTLCRVLSLSCPRVHFV